MSGVPSTPTATDKQEEVRKLNLEIAKLTSAKDTASQAANSAQEAAERAKKRADELEALLRELEQTQASAVADIREFVSVCRNALQVATGLLEVVAQKARDLEEYVHTLCTEIEKRTQELADLRVEFSKENEAMSRKRDDLEIWEERVREAAGEYLPGATIKL